MFTHEGMPPQEGRPRLARMADLLAEFEADAAALHVAKETGKPRGPVTGLTKLDQEIGGVLQPGLHSLNAGSGAGKTALALQIAGSCGFPALFVSCEMSLLELMKRITARTTGAFLGRLKSGEFKPDQARALAQKAAAAVPYLALADATRSCADPDWILAAAEATRGE